MGPRLGDRGLVRRTVKLPPELDEAIHAFMARNRFLEFSEAARQLLWLGVEADRAHWKPKTAKE